MHNKKSREKTLLLRGKSLDSSDSRGARTHDPNIKSVVLYQLS